MPDSIDNNNQYKNLSNYYQVRKIYPWLFSIKDPSDVFCYLIIGEKQSLLYDTMYGIGSLPDLIKKITDKPVTVVLGHGHLDHANGAYQFDEVYLNENDFELCRMHTSPFYRNIIIERINESKQTLPENFNVNEYINAGSGNFKNLEPGKIFDLGGLTIETIAMEGHTTGSIGLFVKEHKILFNSDAANFHVWMFLPESLLISQYIAMLKRTLLLDFDRFFVGHSGISLPKTDMQKMINIAHNASLEKAEPYNVSDLFKEHNPIIYREKDGEIVFNESKLG